MFGMWAALQSVPTDVATRDISILSQERQRTESQLLGFPNDER